MLTICVTHLKPLIPNHCFDVELALGSYSESSDCHASALSKYWHDRRPIAYGAAGSYCIPILIGKIGLPNDGLIGINSYRKVLVKEPIGSPVVGEPNLTLIHPDAAQFIGPDNLRPRGNNQFLVVRPLVYEKGTFAQYARAHKIIDLINYCSLAIDLGILNEKDVDSFFKCRYLIQGGAEFGVYPAEWLVPTLNCLELLGRTFLDRYGERVRDYDPYQVRSVGFLSERLGSFLLLKRLKRIYPQGIPGSLFGVIATVSNDGGYAVGRA